MKSLQLVCIICLVALSTTSLISQEITDKYITILGQAKQQFESKGLELTIDVTEVKENEYQKIRGKSIEEGTNDLLATIANMGYGKKDLAEVFPPSNGYRNNKKTSYKLIVKNEDEAKRLYRMGLKGVSVSKYEYIYDNTTIDDFKLAKDALKDARRKAESLAKEVGMKVGKVLNIEDTSYSGKNRSSRNDRNSKSTYIYKLQVTYSLED